MSVEVAVKFKCDMCGKTIKTTGSAKTGAGRHGSDFVEIPGAFTAKVVTRETGMNSAQLEYLAVFGNVTDHALRHAEQDDDYKIACSSKCVIKAVAEKMERVQ
jgi:hypothetical protein